MSYLWNGNFGEDPPVTEDSVALSFAEAQAGQLRYCCARRWMQTCGLPGLRLIWRSLEWKTEYFRTGSA